ncbi:MAG: PKD domain-containing protein, partial [Candidatus Zixiibacteriota bacterium]
MQETVLNRTAVVFLVVFAWGAVALFSGCDTLVTEQNNITQFDTTLGEACLQCHTDSNDSLIVIPKGQWANSAHASTALLEATVDLNGQSFNTAACGPVCHSGNGFVSFTQNGSVTTNERPSVINCFTCHMPHTGNYGTWRLDLLRVGDSTSVVLNSGHNYKLGKSNQCAVCHQAPTLAPLGNAVTLTGDWGPHFSVQADVVIGTAGFFVDTGAVPSSHQPVKISDGCLNCHFGDGVGYRFGEHTFRLADTATGEQFVSNCNDPACHGGQPVTDFYNFAVLDSISAHADSLRTLLTSVGILDPTDTSGLTIVTDTTIPKYAASILYNYLTYRLDGSRGVHNPSYMDTLLKASLARWDSLPRANFAVNPGDPNLCAPLAVQFVDLSTNVSLYQWDFGDGSAPSSEQNPSHVYSSAGTYTVTLTATGPGGSAIVTKDSIVTVLTTVAAFSIDTTIGCDSLTVQLVNQSPGNIDSVRWDLGDGNQAVGDTVVHTYTTPGTFGVSLIAFGPCGADTTFDTVTVSATPQNVDFTVT